VQEVPIIIDCRPAKTEKGLVDLGPINGKRLMFRAISSQAPTVFVNVLIMGGLIHVPNAAIPFSLGLRRGSQRNHPDQDDKNHYVGTRSKGTPMRVED